ncbi:3-deoxy-7-phosphoheptulonate synthase [Streptomyces sp. NPDC003691]
MQQPTSAAAATRSRPGRDGPANQQPDWRGHAAYPAACARLASAAPLVSPAEVRALRRTLARLTDTGSLVLQLGDCAESLYECTPRHVAEKLKVIDALADRFAELTGGSVVRIGRMGGQFAKPRSRETERHGGREMPSFRGHMINSAIPTPLTRLPNPRRMVWAYQAGAEVHAAMREHRAAGGLPGEGPWSSHEALVIDYESRLIRTDPAADEAYLSSTHFPWAGERTREPGGAHIALLSSVVNPVGCKIGPAADPDDVLRVCAALDPQREPGRLVLIPRMGWDRIRDTLPRLVRGVANAGHPVVWLCDPMHGNTTTSGSGLKTRHLSHVMAEVVAFRDVLEANRQYAGGLHLEVAAADVTECVGGSVPDEEALERRYTSLCDPRLNIHQAGEVIGAWTTGTVPAPR